MNAIFRMAIKDLKILFRDRMGAFFIVGFPILMGVFFGLIMGGTSNGNRSKMQIAIVDLDQSKMSQKFVESLKANDSVQLEEVTADVAQESVRKGQRVAMILLPEGFGKTAGIFWEEAPEIQLGVDPSRTAESGMLQGFIMEAIGSLAGERFQNPKDFKPFVTDSKKDVEAAKDLNPLNRQLMLGFLSTVENMFDSMDQLQTESDDSLSDSASPSFEFAKIKSVDVSREIDPNSQAGQMQKIRSRWDISFPQAMMWGVLGCVAGFSISIARERTMGTMLRLQVAPISTFHVLAGKALACFMTVLGVISMMTVLGIFLGMQPASYPKLVIASLCVAFCFVGIMMTLSVLGKSEQSVSGIGWALNMVMAMFGGCMIPVMFMPGFIQTFSVLSPIKWGILSLEGAIWRDFSIAEMAMPCGILLAIGGAGLALGTVILSKRS